MQEIQQHSQAIASSVEQQNAATGEISHNVARASHGTKVVVAVLQQVAGAVDSNRASADTVMVAVEAVETAAANLRNKIDTFLQKVAI